MSATNGHLFRPEARRHYEDSGLGDSAPHVISPSTPLLTVAIWVLVPLVAVVLALPAPADVTAAAAYDAAGATLTTCLPIREVAGASTEASAVVVGVPGAEIRLLLRAALPATGTPSCGTPGLHARWVGVVLPGPVPPDLRVRAELPARPLWCAVVAPC